MKCHIFLAFFFLWRWCDWNLCLFFILRVIVCSHDPLISRIRYMLYRFTDYSFVQNSRKCRSTVFTYSSCKFSLMMVDLIGIHDDYFVCCKRMKDPESLIVFIYKLLDKKINTWKNNNSFITPIIIFMKAVWQ